jgi:hypothetical protein
MNARRFPPPWSVEEQAACFIVRDANDQALSYVYYENEPSRRSAASEARLAVNIAESAGITRGPFTGRSENDCQRTY